MPPKRTSRKLRPNEQHVLIRKYDISIEGPVRRRDWPPKYTSIFGIVRDMEKIQYDEYSSRGAAGGHARLIHLSKMSNNVEMLVSEAHSLRSSFANEETWRLKTEHLVLKRFDMEVDCHVCRNRRWISDFHAVPTCEASAARLQSMRQRRLLCQCEEHVRAKLLMLAHHRPDRVLGLGRTHELEQLLAANPSILSTVLGEDADMDLYFPFLVIEAKSEKNTVGFESIERQTVFPIRAMLGLQRSLQAATGVQLDPMRVIDLWHGSILRHDSALQLLLIVDLICDWARDIFQHHILDSLRAAAGPDFPGLLSHNSIELVEPEPVHSPHSYLDIPLTASEAPGATAEQLSAASSPEPEIKPEFLVIPPDVAMGYVATSEPQPEALPPSIQSKKYQATVEDESDADIVAIDRFHAPSPSRSPTITPTPTPSNNSRNMAGEGDITGENWRKYLAIRAQTGVEVQFGWLSLPESAHDLAILLSALDREENIVETALRMLKLFNYKTPLVIERGFVDRVRRAWGQSNHAVHKDTRLVYACLTWRAGFNYVEWTVTKELAFVTASEVAFAALARLAGLDPSHLFPRIRSTKLADGLIAPLRFLPLPELLQAASKKKFLHLITCIGWARPDGWVEDPGNATLSERLWKCRVSIPKAFPRCKENIYVSSHRMAFLEPREGVPIPAAIHVPQVSKDRRFALLRVPSGERDIHPPYCAFLFDKLGTSDAQSPGPMIKGLLRDGLGCFYGTDTPLTALDRRRLAQIARLLS
ncbi:hypothetical protein BJY04DRAFT_209403 [Aspergillus karnatakaensis]|uniref:uncharacterized protein n=1 Tax=Aspergillus karnatakaensis TaxID=1810916 RepID=UPI003CCD4124